MRGSGFWLALKTGLERSNNLSARSWLNVGLPITTPEPGDVVIFWRDQRESWQGHVAFFTGFSTDSTRIYCLGGNQGNQVSITAYPALRLLGFRRLRPIAVTHFSQKDLKLGDTGAAVVKLQDSLKQLGLKVGTSDGVFGSMTESALKDFQSTNTELKINGIFDNDTRAFLSAKIPLQQT